MPNNLILGITKVGDLLLKNTITLASKGEQKAGEITNIKLTIPDYQRPYKWTAKNSNQLLDDIIQAMSDKKEVYRVGTLILHKNASSVCYEIVDGQQRTITFSLLLKALEEEKINFLDEELNSNEFNLHNIKNNYRAFCRRLGKNIEEDKDLKEFIKEKCEFIVVITDDLSESFQFFDSQNARGKSLYPHDLLKAYHLREMRNISESKIIEIVKIWEDLDQKKLSSLFKDYLYRLKEWIKCNKAQELTEKNIDLFKGITSNDNHPYAQFFKGAFAYADNLNHSAIPFVTGSKLVKPFQLNTPIIAGKPFFEYTKHYFDLLSEIQNNDKYTGGYFINNNEIVKTLDRYFCRRVGDKITRLMFDTAILLYVDRFCPLVPSPDTDLVFFNKFVEYAFVWAYSMRAQYHNVGWLVAQNYITENSEDKKNSLNLYKLIVDTDNPNMLISELSDILSPLSLGNDVKDKKDVKDKDENGIFVNYLYYFDKLKFLEN